MKSRLLVFCFSIIISLPVTAQSVIWADTVLQFSSQKSDKGFSAQQALGKPSRFPNPSHSTCAWSPEYSDERSAEFIEVGFTPPVSAQQLIVIENYNPGHITGISVVMSNGTRRTVTFSPSATTGGAGKLTTIPLTDISEPIQAIRITFSKPDIYNTYQIDAIGLSNQLKAPTLKVPVVEDATKGEAEHLNTSVNSSSDEVYPLISPDGSVLYFDRKFFPGNMGDQHLDDIWYSTHSDMGWSEAAHQDPPLNNEGINFICSISPDGNTALVGSGFSGDENTAGIAISRRTALGWSTPQPLVIRNFHNSNQYNEFSLTADGNTLVMSIQNQKSLGLLDLYVSFRQADGTFSEPLHMGNVINSAGNEMTPFLAADGKTLYFSSNGFAGFGNQDVFMSRRLDNTWLHWSEPLNMGPKINTAEWESYYNIDAAGTYAYFSSSFTSGSNLDIFRIQLPPAAKPDQVIWMKGVVEDRLNGNRITANIQYNAITDTTITGISNATEVSGYAVLLPELNTYRVQITATGYYSADTLLALTAIDSGKTIWQNFSLIPRRNGVVIEMQNILFEVNSDVLEDSSYLELDKVVRFLQLNPAVEIEIRGHTNGLCADDYCNSLSARRAKRVMDYFISQGIASARLTYKGYGKTVPIDTNATPEGRRRNQRVEFMITKS